MKDPRGSQKTVLVVAHRQEDVDLICEVLNDIDYDYITAHTGIEALSVITYRLPHIIISEIYLPELNGYELCRKIRAGIKTRLIPFIFIAPSDKVDDRIAALQTGADAFLARPFNADELRALVRSKVNSFDELYHLSVTDDLTRLFNRREFLKRFAGELENPRTQSVALCILDLDFFKKVNDTYGHQTGDLVLMKLADMLKNRSSDNFFPARFGGEEFVILLPGTSAPSAVTTIDSLRDELAATPFRHAGSSEVFHISFSAGIAEYPSMASNISELLSRADQALYAAKNDGRARTYIFRPIMARNDRFWEYLKTCKGTFFEAPFNEPVSKLPYLPQTLEQIINLDYEVRSIGVLIIKLQPLFNLRELRGQKNMDYDVENIKFIISWACECNFPSDIYLAVTNFFSHEVVALFPSIVDFSYNPEKFKTLCRDISMDFFVFILNYFFDIYFSGDVIYFEKWNPRNLLDEIEHIRDRVYLLDDKRDFFVNIFNEVRQALYDSSSLKGVLEIRSFYNFLSMKPSYNYFSSCNFIIKADFTELLLRESIVGSDDFERFMRLFAESFSDEIECPLVIPWVSAVELDEYARLLGAALPDREVVLMLNESVLESFPPELLVGIASDLPGNVSLGIDNCYIGNDILNILSTVDLRLLCFSENIIRNIHLFPDRIKIINGLKLFADELGIPVLARNILLEDEFQILKDLKIFHASGPFISNMRQSS
ncbi:MAG TPA: diguanylate cyclase [Spirochaetota bacterium]|nr:diguanylate cyclase [Spirochaetota bacterium]